MEGVMSVLQENEVLISEVLKVIGACHLLEKGGSLLGFATNMVCGKVYGAGEAMVHRFRPRLKAVPLRRNNLVALSEGGVNSMEENKVEVDAIAEGVVVADTTPMVVEDVVADTTSMVVEDVVADTTSMAVEDVFADTMSGIVESSVAVVADVNAENETTAALENADNNVTNAGEKRSILQVHTLDDDDDDEEEEEEEEEEEDEDEDEFEALRSSPHKRRKKILGEDDSDDDDILNTTLSSPSGSSCPRQYKKRVIHDDVSDEDE